MARTARQPAPQVLIDDEFEGLARQLQGRLDAITARYMELITESAPPWFDDDPLAMKLTAGFAREAIAAALRAHATETLPDSSPEIDAAAVRETARMGVGIDFVLSGYRAGHRAIWEAWFELVNEQVESEPKRQALLERGSRFGFDYVNRTTQFATEAYEQERELATRSRDQRRMHAVRELLDGADPKDVSLDWPLEHHHLAVFAWGDGGDVALRELATLLERPALIVQPTEGWWGWLSSARPLSANEQRQLSRWQPSAGRMSCGLEAAGPDGFRRSHFQATRARWVAPSREERLLRFEDVGLEVLAGELREDARAFLAHELGELNGDSARAGRLRETLEAYFAAGHNAAAAAAALGIHQQTVGNRIHSIEERLGASVESRRAELETALRLRRCFAAAGELQAALQENA